MGDLFFDLVWVVVGNRMLLAQTLYNVFTGDFLPLVAGGFRYIKFFQCLCHGS